MAKGSSLESPVQRVCMIFLVYCIASLFYYVLVVSYPYVIYYPTVMAQYSLFVLKMPLNLSKQTIIIARLVDKMPYHTQSLSEQNSVRVTTFFLRIIRNHPCLYE